MSEAIHQDVVVEQAGVIIIRSPRLNAGAKAKVTVVFDEEGTPRLRSLKSLIGSGRGCFDSPEDADDFIRKERDSWS